MKRRAMEENFYPLIAQKLMELFNRRDCNVFLQITAKGFGSEIKKQIPDNRHIIFSFLGTKPDITGFIRDSGKFIVVEVKDRKLNLGDIYQLRKYVDLFDAKFPFLVSTWEIPVEIKALSKVEFRILERNYPLPKLTLVCFDKNSNKFVDWFKENPFEKDLYWR